MATRPKFARMANYSCECGEASHIFLKNSVWRMLASGLANVGEFGESAQHGSASVGESGESGESARHGSANVGESGESVRHVSANVGESGESV